MNTADNNSVDLKALQVQIQKNLEKDFTPLINAKFKDFHTDFKESFARLDTRYDDLSATVKLLTQQQQCMHDTLDAIQNNLRHPSSSHGGDRHA